MRVLAGELFVRLAPGPAGQLFFKASYGVAFIKRLSTLISRRSPVVSVFSAAWTARSPFPYAFE